VSGEFWIRSFDDINEAFAAIRAGERAANEAATPEQVRITWGDFFEIPADLNGGLHAWGRVFGREEFADGERELGADEEEIAGELAMLDDAFRRGWRMSRTHSALMPDGEIGSVHVCKMRQITGREFGRAREEGWAS
jgi:hypothetical protein